MKLFAMRFAEQFQRADWREFLDELSGECLDDWMEYEITTGLLGHSRVDAPMALIAMLIAETNRDSKRRKAPYRLDEFLCYANPFVKRKEMSSPEEVFKYFQRLAKGKGKRGRGKNDQR